MMIRLLPLLWLVQMLALPAPAASDAVPTPQIAFRDAHRDGPLRIAFSPDNKMVATGDYDGIIKLWDAHNGELLRTISISQAVGRSGGDAANHELPREEFVYSLAFSPDSAMLLSGSSNGDRDRPQSHALLWDTKTGKLRRQLGEEGSRGLLEEINTVAFLPPGNRVAVSAYHRDPAASEVNLWDAQTGRLLRRIPNANRPVFSPDGTRMACASLVFDAYEQSAPGVKLWDVKTGTLLQTLDTEQLLSNKLLFSPDGKTLVSIAGPPGMRGVYLNPNPWDIDHKPDKIFLWDTRSGAKRHTLVRNTSAIYNLAFAPDSKTLASSHTEIPYSAPSDSLFSYPHNPTTCEVIVWEVATGTPLQTLPCEQGISALIYTPGSRLITIHAGSATSSQKSRDVFLTVWNPITGTRRHVVSLANLFGPSSIACTPYGKTLILSGSVGGSIRWLDAESLRLRSFAPGRQENVLPLACSPDGRLLVSGGSNAEVAHLWDLHTGRMVRRLSATSPLFGGTPEVAFAPDGKTVATLRPDTLFEGVPSEISLWDVHTGHRQFTLKRDLPPASERPHVDGGVLDGLVLAPFLWNSFAFTPDGMTLVTAGRNGLSDIDHGQMGLAWWNVPSGTLRFLPSVDTGGVHALAISLNGKLLAATHDKEAVLWDAVTGVQIKSLRPRDITPTDIGSLAFSSDSTMLVVGQGNLVHVWDVSNGTEIDRLEGHTGQIRAVAFSPDGVRIASAGEDGTVRLWDLSPRRKLAGALSAHLLPDGIDNLWSQYNVRIVFQQDRPMTSVVFSPDGRLLIGASQDATLHYWNARTGVLLLTTRTFLPRDSHTPSAWISYTPEGYYAGSSDIKDYLRWQVGDRLLPAATFERRYHRPERVADAFKTP